MKLIAEPYKIAYYVPLSEAQWRSLNAVNKRGDDRRDEVSTKLEKAGAFSIEYNGHLGRNIFFEVESADKLPGVLKSIERIVSK